MIGVRIHALVASKAKSNHVCAGCTVNGSSTPGTQPQQGAGEQVGNLFMGMAGAVAIVGR